MTEPDAVVEATLLDAIAQAIRSTEDVTGEVLVTGYVVVASFADDTGESSVFTAAAENQRCHTSLGLLEFGAANERYVAVHGERPEADS
jgi:hypothetical protein